MPAGMGARVWITVGALALTSACTRAMFVAPAGPGAPAPDAAAAWRDATSRCRAAKTYVAALRVSGKVANDRLWPVSIETAVTADESVYLSASAAGQSVFVLSGSNARATLWLRGDDRIVTAPPADIMDAIVGAPLAPSRLLAILTGCTARSFDINRATAYGALVAIDTADARVFLSRQRGAWRTRAAEAETLTVEFAGSAGGGPRDVWIWSRAQGTLRASLHLTASDVEIDGAVPASVFTTPPGATGAKAMTLDELRAAGPFRNR